MRAAFVIAAKDLRQRLRDRSAVVLGFVAPLAIAVLMSFAIQGGDDFHLHLGLVDEDRQALAVAFGEALAQPELRAIVTVVPMDDEAGAAAAVDGGELDAAIVIPAGFTGALAGDAPQPLRLLTSVDGALAGQVARSIAASFSAQVDADRLAVATALAAGAPPEDLGALVAAAGDLRLPIVAEQRPSGARPLAPISYFGPAMGIFFVLFAISFGSRGYFIEQRDGTLERMSAAVRPGVVLAGKALSVFVYGVASLTTMALFTSVVFDADWGGPAPAAALIVSVVLAVVCLTALVSLVARTERQAEGLAAMLTFGLALVGGSFVQVSASPALIRRLALLTPNGWAMRGFLDLATGERSLGTVVEPVAGILAFCAAVVLATVVLSRRMLAR